MKPFANYQVPNPSVLEETPRGERHYDVYSRLLKDRIIYLGTPVMSTSANMIIAQMLFLAMNDPEKPIHLYINSPGGSVSDGLAIYDMMQHVQCPVYTYAIGMAASMGSFLLMAGEPGHRFAMPNAKIMIHQPHLGDGGIGGQVTDIEIQAKELIKTKEKLTEAYHIHCNQPLEVLRQLMERDYYMRPEEAKNLGLIDDIVLSDKSKRLRKK